MIVHVRVCDRTQNSPGTKWNINLFVFLIHAHQKYVTSYAFLSNMGPIYMYTFGQTPSLHVHA